MNELMKNLGPILTVGLPFLIGLLTLRESKKKSSREEFDSLINHYRDEAQDYYEKWQNAEKKIEELNCKLNHKEDTND
ncbi:hypothetical protein ACNAN0_03970 [Agrilactobacillus fermenti]|uniref:hypothetical protein n=1 Tax=Agrilactobacillus fermenti TaxID=2586909 RepID=UPI003A5C0F62